MHDSPRRSTFSTLHSPLSILLAVLLLLALYAQMMGSVRFKSATYDEQEYVARGYAVLRTGDMRLRLRHPLLTNLVGAAPLLLLPDLKVPTDHGSWANAEFHEFSAQFLWTYNRQWADQIVYLSRWPMMLLTVVLAACVYRWARTLYGPGGGLLALAVVAFDPNLIAHGRLANTDIGATAFIFIAAYAFWEYQRRPCGRRLLLAGVACGLAQATRFTALLLFPVFGLELLIAAWRPESIEGWRERHGSWWHKLGRAVLVLLALASISLVTIWAIHGFTWGPVDGTCGCFLSALSLPAPDYWGEFLSLTQRIGRTDRAFLLGRIYEGGWWPYFFVAFAVKTPLPTLLLAGWATVRLAKRGGGVRRPRLSSDISFLLPAVAYFAIAVAGNLNTGYRLILPVLPFLAVHTARGCSLSALAPSPCPLVSLSPVPSIRLSVAHPLTFLPPRLVSRSLLRLVLIAWLITGVLLIYPHYLAYFNELVGPRNGYKVLVDSNLDWGQDLPGLRAWMDEYGIDQVYLSWFGVAPPEHYGVRYRYLPGWPPFEHPALRVYHLQRPLPGVYTISATNLQGVLLDDPDTFAFFRDQPSVAQVGHSIMIYQVPAAAPPANLALGGVRFDQVPASLLDAHLGTNDLRLRWFDPASSLVLPPHQSGVCYAIGEAPFLADPLVTRFLDGLRPLAEGPGFRFYPCPDDADVDDRLDVAAASPVLQSPEVEFSPGDAPALRSSVFLPASFDGQVAFLGYEYLTPSPVPGEEMALLTYWRVLQSPEHPLKVFVHLLDDHSRIWGQHDGLDVPVEGWVPGDIVVQLHALTVAADTPPGRYWVEVGLYEPQTLERLPVLGDDGVPLGNRLLLREGLMQ